MSTVWRNNFNHGSSAYITPGNSAEHGEPIGERIGDPYYTGSFLFQGTWVMFSGVDGGFATTDLGIGEDEPFALRFYMARTARSSIVVGTGLSGEAESSVLSIFRNDYEASSIIGGATPEEIEEIPGGWTRVDYIRRPPGQETEILFFWGDNNTSPDLGTADMRFTAPGGGPAVDRVYIRGGIPLNGEEQGGSYVDEVAVVTDTTEMIGPDRPGVVTWSNTFNGVNAATINVSNSGNYGNRLNAVNNASYSHDWYIQNSGGGVGSARVGTGTESGFIDFEPDTVLDEWTIRFYTWIDSGRVQYGGTYNFFEYYSDTNQFWVFDQPLHNYAPIFVGRTIRVECRREGDTLTLRLWWADPHSWGPSDLQISAQPDISEDLYFEFFGGIEGGFAYIDELVLVDAAQLVGPVQISEAITSIYFDATATGVVGGYTNAVGEIVLSVNAEGFRSDNGAAVDNVIFAAQADGGGYVYTRAEEDVHFHGEATGGPLYVGDAEDTVRFEAETSTSKYTSGEALEGEITYETAAAGRARTHLPDVPLVGMQYRLIAYDPDGQRRGQLPWPLSFQLGVPLNDTPSLALEYLKDAPGADLLDSLCEVAVELAPAGSPTFIEPPGCRFLNLRHQEDPADRTGVVRYTMPSYVWMLRKVRNLNTNSFNEEGQRDFSSATPGRIVHTFLIEAQQRGNIPGMAWDFTTTHDSAGQPWENAYNITFDAGQDLWSIVEALSTQHALDWRVHRRTFQMYNPDSAMSRDRAEQAILRMHRDVTEAPNDRSGEELASRIFVQGDNAHAQITNNSGMQPWGAWEDYISQNGVSDTGTLITLAQWRLEATRGLRTQMTRGILFNTARHLPFFAYQVGDYISAPGWFSQQDPLRVRQITISSTDPHSLEGNLVLNDRFIERQLRNDRKLNALTSGSPPGGGGGGGRPPGEDTRTPRAPQSLLLNSDAYIDPLGNPRAQITADWEEVTHATNNTEINIEQYQVWLRHAVFGAPFQLQTVVDSPDTTAHMSGRLEPDEVYEVRVRAVGRNERPGLWSETVAVRAERDAVPPDEPSGPQLSSRLGVIRVAWDGLDYQGLGMPSDFDHLQVWMSGDPATEFEHVDTLYRAGVSVIPNQPYGERRWFFFVALDRAGNESDPSPMASIATEQLVPTDVAPGSIGYELLEEGAVRDEILADDAVRNRHIAAGQITGEKIRAYSLTADRIAVGNTRNLLTDPKFLNEDLNELRSELSAGVWSYEESTSGNSASISIGEDNPPGNYEFRFIQSLESGSQSDRRVGYNVSAELGRVIFRSQLDVELGGTGTVLVIGRARFVNREDVLFDVATAVSQQTFSSSSHGYEFISDIGAAVPEDAIAAVVCVGVNLSMAPAGTTVRIRNPFSAMSDGQVLIENGAISANKIQANAVTTDKIQAGAIRAQHIQANAIEAEQIAARAITAKHTIVGANIRTTAEANQGVVMNINGIMAHDSVGNQTFTVSSRTGNVNIVGRLRTGWSGENRVEVSDSANYMNQPGVRLYSGGIGARDSSLFIADAVGTGGWDPYTVALTGSEATRNTSGRTDLVLRHGNGGGGALRYQWGSWGLIGIQFSGHDMYIGGRNTSGQSPNDYFVWGRTTTFTGGGTGSGLGNWSNQIINYGAAVPNGGRLVQVSGHANREGGRIISTVTQQRRTHLRLTGTAYDGGNFRLQYLSMWVDESVA